MDEAIEEEKKMIIEKEKSGEIKSRLINALKNKQLDKKYVPLTVCYDMGWNKRSTGTRYDSISGHGIMVGGYSKKSCVCTNVQIVPRI